MGPAHRHASGWVSGNGQDLGLQISIKDTDRGWCLSLQKSRVHGKLADRRIVRVVENLVELDVIAAQAIQRGRAVSRQSAAPSARSLRGAAGFRIPVWRYSTTATVKRADHGLALSIPTFWSCLAPTEPARPARRRYGPGQDCSGPCCGPASCTFGADRLGCSRRTSYPIGQLGGRGSSLGPRALLWRDLREPQRTPRWRLHPHLRPLWYRVLRPRREQQASSLPGRPTPTVPVPTLPMTTSPDSGPSLTTATPWRAVTPMFAPAYFRAPLGERLPPV